MNIISDFINYLASNAQTYAASLLGAVATGIIGWWIINKVSKLSEVFFQKTCNDIGLSSFFSSLLKFSLRILLLIIVLACLGFNVSSIIAAMGASIIAVGISLKESLSNFVSGVVLIINKPIHVGDFIEFEGSSGTVLKIEMFYTILKTSEEGKTVIIPNTKLVSSIIVRKSKYDILEVNVNYKFKGDFSFKEIQKFLNKEFILNSSILQIPSPQINMENKSENEADLKIKIWAQSRYSKKVKEDVDKIILKLSSKYGINIETENL